MTDSGYAGHASESARHRRTEASSSESSDAGGFPVSNVKFRVAAPAPPPLPMETRWNAECEAIRKALGDDLEDKVKEIISSEGHSLSGEVHLVLRSVPGAHSEGQPTVLIVAEWDTSSPPIWERIVKKTKKFVDAKSLASEGLDDIDIAVEMIAPELTFDKYMSAVPEAEFTPGLETDWTRIVEKVERILESYPATKSKVTSIALFKLGFLVDVDKNPLTVYVSLRYESEESKWPPIVAEIQGYLDTFQYGLHVHLEHNIPESYPTFPVIQQHLTEAERRDRTQNYNFNPDRRYETLVGLGDDIGVGKYLSREDGVQTNSGVGTLGCWVEMKTKRCPQWTRYALTNYHVIRPAIDGFQLGSHPTTGRTIAAAPVTDSDLWKADLAGVSPHTNFASSPMLIEHPSRAKHCFAVQVLGDQIATNSPGPAREGIEQHLRHIRAFFDDDKQVFGTIHGASGYTRRTPKNGRLDWALIKPIDPGRVGRNTLPTKQDWSTHFVYANLPKLSAMGGNLRQPPPNGLRSTQNRDSLFKLGASTGPTAGRFSGIRVKVAINEDRHLETHMTTRSYLSDEFVYIGDPENTYFANRGDSGSVVFDRDGRAVGLLYRGHMAQQARNSCAFITPIEDVFDDIKKFSKGGITDIRIAEY